MPAKPVLRRKKWMANYRCVNGHTWTAPAGDTLCPTCLCRRPILWENYEELVNNDGKATDSERSPDQVPRHRG